MAAKSFTLAHHQSSPDLSGAVAARSQAESWCRIIAIIVGSATTVPEITATASE